MNKQQAIHAALILDATYMNRWGVPKRSEAGVGPDHLRWMVQEMAKGEFSEDKTMRWLGYIQGVLVCCYGCDLEDMKAINKAQTARAYQFGLPDLE